MSPTLTRARETATRVARGLATPVIPEDYLDLFAPLRSGADLRGRIVAITPETADAAEEGSAALISALEDLEARLNEITDDHAGDTVFFTEPVGGYFAAAAGLEDVTVDGFAEAVENGEGVAPAVLNDALKAIEGGEVAVLIANAHTGGSETDRVIAAAEDSDVPVVEFTETVPDGSDYVTWMTDNADALADALS